MHRIIFSLILISIFLSSLACAAQLQPGDKFPDLKLEGTLTPEHKADLGLQGEGPWAISEIKEKFLLVEIYSMYCPHCQKEAPAVNSLCSLIDKSAIGKKLQVIGIAAGNSEFEIDFYREKYGVEFPLFADTDLNLHSELGAPGTPHFYLLQIENGAAKVLLSHAGPFKEAKNFLQTINKCVRKK